MSAAPRQPDDAVAGCPLFVVPYRNEGYRRPMAPWLTTAGLAGAARRRWGDARILGPDGWSTVEEARAHATADAAATSAPSVAHRSGAASALRAAASDVRKVTRLRRFGRSLGGVAVPPVPVPFVWQRHDLGLSARRLAVRVDAPLVVSVHALVGRERAGWRHPAAAWSGLLERSVERPVLRHAELVTCVSEELARQVVDAGVGSDRVVVVPNGVDTERFRPDLDGDRVRAELGVEGRTVIGWVGSFRPFHGLDGLVRAYARVAAGRDDLALVLVGSGQEQASLEALARELGAPGVVFAGPQPFEAMPEVLAAFDVGVVAGGAGSFHYSPVKLREYLAAGLAVVAPDAGEIGRTHVDGRDAVLVAPGDDRALAEGLARVVDDPGLRSSLARQGRRWVTEHGSWDGALHLVVAALAPGARQVAS